MAPKLSTKTSNKKNTLNTAKPQVASTINDAPSPAINYGEVQDDEIAVLQAIYMDDYQALEVKGAWSKTTDRSFKLHLRSFSDPDACVDLSVTFTATYPKTVPLLDVQGLDTFHERTQKRIRNVIQSRPLKLIGEVMIHIIGEEIRDALEDAVISRQQGTLPSLIEERASAEEVASTMAKAAEEAEARQVRETQAEEERMLKQMVSEEVHRREKRKPIKHANESSVPTSSEASSDIVSFDNAITFELGGGTETFREVLLTALVTQNGNESTFLAKPRDAASVSVPILSIKRQRVTKDRSEIIELESILNSVQKLRHMSLLNLLAYRVNKIDNISSELIICQEYADRGTLQDLLSFSDVHLDKARQWTIELLEGLDFIHRNGVAHGDLGVHNVALVGSPNISAKLDGFGFAAKTKVKNSEPATKWSAPELDKSLASQRHTDIWNLGVILVQLVLGLSATTKYYSPSNLTTKLELSASFEDIFHKIFATDHRKRPTAFDLLPAEFLRTDSPVIQQMTLQLPRFSSHQRRTSSGVGSPLQSRRGRHNSSGMLDPVSRYISDFTEMGRLGKGGFGEVVKARNKLDGGIYAIKKIRQAPQLLDKVLSEVMLLNRLNHPYVVRYFSTWVEMDMTEAISEEAVSTSEDVTTDDDDDDTSDSPRIDFGYASTGGLDFVSSSSIHGFEFGVDSSDGDDSSGDSTEDGEDDTDPFERGSTADDDVDDASQLESSRVNGSLILTRPRSDSHRPTSIMYIQMEYCERRTLRDLIHRGLDEDDSWRYVRQITEGLAHIHSHGIIHRDLKPDNVFLDVAMLPKIGDFGLATTGQYQIPERQSGLKGGSVDMTRSIGTALYTAPELRSKSGSSYTDKVDMYSLGIMFFEMSNVFTTAMERINELQAIRKKDFELPAELETSGEKAAQGRLIKHLISHKPSERPSSTELLRSDILPIKIEDETIRQALSGLSDPRSPYHQKMMSALFAHDTASSQRVKALAWEAKASTLPEDIVRIRLRGIVRSSLENVFRRHGAEETRRDSILPRSAVYTSPNVMQLLDASGNLLQLPYDLTLPHAQQLARQACSVRCTFAFGCAYRDAFTGGPPRANEEADFDIINNGSDDIALDDAEVIKVIGEVIRELPVSNSSQGVAIYLNHGALLDAILDHCRVSPAQHHAVKEILSKLGFQQWSWIKIRSELRNMGLTDTTLDDIQQFDFRDGPGKAFGRLQALLEDAALRDKARWESSRIHLEKVLNYVDQFGSSLKLQVAPLSCFNAKFYERGLLFQCVVERKSNRVVIAAGGRYDSLIEKHRPAEGQIATRGAVGLCIGIDPMVSHIAKLTTGQSKGTFMKDVNQSQRLPKRCEVLVVASGGGESLQSAGVKILSTLWSHDISAELAQSTVLETDYSFIVTLRHAASNNVKVAATDGSDHPNDAEVSISSLVTHLHQEFRERTNHHHHARTRIIPPLLRSHSSQQYHHGGSASASANINTKSSHGRNNNNVHVLLARHGSKKSNKYHIVEAAQARWVEKLDSLKSSASILAVETRDDVLDLIDKTILSEPETWRGAVQSVPLGERVYVGQIQEVLAGWKREWVDDGGGGGGGGGGTAGVAGTGGAGGGHERVACVFNFRTGKCLYYDLGL
jgi:translation initiation factor 2-alpha kinase 4